MRTVTRKVAADETALLNKISQQRQLTASTQSRSRSFPLPPPTRCRLSPRVPSYTASSSSPRRRLARPAKRSGRAGPPFLARPSPSSSQALTHGSRTAHVPLPTLPFRSARNPMTLSLVVSQESYLSRNTRPPDRRQTDRRARHPHPQRRATGRALAR